MRPPAGGYVVGEHIAEPLRAAGITTDDPDFPWQESVPQDPWGAEPSDPMADIEAMAALSALIEREELAAGYRPPAGRRALHTRLRDMADRHQGVAPRAGGILVSTSAYKAIIALAHRAERGEELSKMERDILILAGYGHLLPEPGARTA